LRRQLTGLVKLQGYLQVVRDNLIAVDRKYGVGRSIQQYFKILVRIVIKNDELRRRADLDIAATSPFRI
jgi:hypothetical protein